MNKNTVTNSLLAVSQIRKGNYLPGDIVENQVNVDADLECKVTIQSAISAHLSMTATLLPEGTGTAAPDTFLLGNKGRQEVKLRLSKSPQARFLCIEEDTRTSKKDGPYVKIKMVVPLNYAGETLDQSFKKVAVQQPQKPSSLKKKKDAETSGTSRRRQTAEGGGGEKQSTKTKTGKRDKKGADEGCREEKVRSSVTSSDSEDDLPTFGGAPDQEDGHLPQAVQSHVDDISSCDGAKAVSTDFAPKATVEIIDAATQTRVLQHADFAVQATVDTVDMAAMTEATTSLSQVQASSVETSTKVSVATGMISMASLLEHLGLGSSVYRLATRVVEDFVHFESGQAFSLHLTFRMRCDFEQIHESCVVFYETIMNASESVGGHSVYAYSLDRVNPGARATHDTVLALPLSWQALLGGVLSECYSISVTKGEQLAAAFSSECMRVALTNMRSGSSSSDRRWNINDPNLPLPYAVTMRGDIRLSRTGGKKYTENAKRIITD